MLYVVRLVNAYLGGAIAVRDSDGFEYKLAVFADAVVEDFAFAGDHLCVLISRKGGIALLDLHRREVVERARLSFQPEGIVVSPDGSRAVAWAANPGRIGVVDLPSLTEALTFNLAERRTDGGYNLVYRTADELQKQRLRLVDLPYVDAPLCQMRFSKRVRPAFRADGHIVMPIEYNEKGPDFVWDHIDGKPLSSSFFQWTVGIAELDLDAARIDFRPFRYIMEQMPQCHFEVRAISPDGQLAVLHSASPIAGPAKDRPEGGALARVFGRRGTKRSWAYGLELWDIAGKQPIRKGVTAFHAFRDDGIMHPTSVRLTPADAETLRPEIDLVMPGLLAVLSGRGAEWHTSAQKRAEDAYFVPRETAATRPAFRPGFGRVADPLLFGPVMRQLLEVQPGTPQEIPWADLSNRQKWFLSHFIRGWGFHARTPVMAVAWTSDPDRVVVLGRNGIVREISFAQGPGVAFEVRDPPHPSHGFDWSKQDAQLIPLGNRSFAVDYFSARFEFDLPQSTDFGFHNLEGTRQLPIRVITDHQQHVKESAYADSLTRAIRPGYITIDGRAPAQIVAGLEKLAPELRANFDEIVVDNRWAPALFHRGKPIEEMEFCDILVRDGSQAARTALETLLLAWLERTSGTVQPVWHPDDETPAMGPVALALVQLCEPIPGAVMTFFSRRDPDHDNWTPEAWQALALSPYRLAQPELLALRIRLALQDISTGNIGPDLFALYNLDQDREKLRADLSQVETYARLVAAQIRAQWPDLASAGNSRGAFLVEKIVGAIDLTAPAEAALVAALRGQLPHADSPV
jgi:hypothetical protein